MTSKAKRPSGRAGEFVELTIDTFRNLTNQLDKDLDRKVFTGQMPIEGVMNLPTDENVRDYLVDAEGKQRKRQTLVHVAIEDTLKNNPWDFAILNGGITIVARDHEIDEQRKILRLHRPSIINGSQTQGVIRRYLADNRIEKPTDPIFVKFELIVTNDENLIAETSIARNYQNDVQLLSIVGRRGHLDALEKAVQKKLGDVELRKGETDHTGLPTEKLIQVITALMPQELWIKRKPKEQDPNKVYTYSMKAKCLREFDEIYKEAHALGESKPVDVVERAKEVYQYYLDISGEAWLLYQKWKRHPGFEGSGIRNAVTRDEDGRTIIDVQDGMIFPILAAFSAFVVKTEQGWEIRPPTQFNDEDLIPAAIRAYQRIAHHNPWIMGKDPGCYAMCYEFTSLYRKLTA